MSDRRALEKDVVRSAMARFREWDAEHPDGGRGLRLSPLARKLIRACRALSLLDSKRKRS
jgi:hypothetical protein